VQLAKLAGPLVVSSAADYFGKLLTTIFAGHILSTAEFDAVALGNTMTNITGYSMIIAFASPMDSLCTQSAGARNWTLYAVTVWRALICTALFLIPTVVLWVKMEEVLVLCGQSHEIAHNVYRWTLIYLAMLPAYTVRTILIRFLSSQGISKPLFYIGIAVYIIWHPSWLLLVFKAFRKTDFLWFPACNVVTTYVQIALILGYISISKPHHPQTVQRVPLSTIFRWRTTGHDRDAQSVQSESEESFECSIVSENACDQRTSIHVVDKGLSEYIQLLAAGIFSICGEWWSWEVITLIVGLLGPTQLAADVIYSAMIPMYFMIPLGIGLAGASRVGALIGENRHRLAKQLGDAILSFTLFVASSLAAVSFLLREYIPRMFSKDQAVIDIAVKLSPSFCAFIVCHGLQGSFLGILRGIKRQGKSVYAVLIGPWLISIPLSCLLAFQPEIDWEIYGMWAGNNVGYYVMDAIFLYLWLSFDWNRGEELEKTREC